MVEQFVEGIQYLGTIIVSVSDEIKLDSLEEALKRFKPRGVHASLETKFTSNVSIDVYVDVARPNKRFMPPLVTGETAKAYNDLIQTLGDCGYSEPEVFRDSSRTGIREPNENPLFEIADTTSH